MNNKAVSTYLQQLEALNKSDHQQFLTLYKKLADLAENKALQSNSLPWHNLNLEVNKSFKIVSVHDEQSSNVPFNLENLFEWNYLNEVKNDLQNLIQRANFNEHKIELESNSVDGHFNILI